MITSPATIYGTLPFDAWLIYLKNVISVGALSLSGAGAAAVTPNSTWQKLTISVTPTADGVVEFCAYAYGYGSNILYYDKIEHPVQSQMITFFNPNLIFKKKTIDNSILFF